MEAVRLFHKIVLAATLQFLAPSLGSEVASTLLRRRYLTMTSWLLGQTLSADRVAYNSRIDDDCCKSTLELPSGCDWLKLSGQAATRNLSRNKSSIYRRCAIDHCLSSIYWEMKHELTTNNLATKKAASNQRRIMGKEWAGRVGEQIFFLVSLSEV